MRDPTVSAAASAMTPARATAVVAAAARTAADAAAEMARSSARLAQVAEAAAAAAQETFFVVNQYGTVESVNRDHPAVEASTKGGADFRFATDDEIDAAFAQWKQNRPPEARPTPGGI